MLCFLGQQSEVETIINSETFLVTNKETISSILAFNGMRQSRGKWIQLKDSGSALLIIGKN